MNLSGIFTPLNISFTIAMSLVAVYFISKYWNNAPKLKFASPFLIGLGVLGTFVGIFQALMNFDPMQIQSSISSLLEGLKTAFLTSIIGMILSMFINLIAFVKDSTSKKQQATNPIETLINLQIDSINKQEELSKINNQSLNKIVNAIVGDGDATLITQIQKLRMQMQDGFDKTSLHLDKLIVEFNGFATKMAENNYNALIIALKEVIGDFNAKINEQFGENFKHLNEGVGKMLVWQDNYAMTIEIQTRALEDTIAGIEKVSSHFETIVSNSERFDEVASSLNVLLNALNQQRNELQEKLEEFSDIGDSAKNAFDIIDEKVNELISTISNSIKTQSERTSNVLKTVDESLKNQSSKLSETQESFKHTLNLVVEKNKELSAEITNKVSHTIGEQSKKLTEMQENMNTEVKRVLIDNSNATTEFLKKGNEKLASQFIEFDKMLQTELEKSLHSLGNQLVSLSSKFVQDYTPLTNQLRNIITIAEGLGNGTLRN